MYTYSIFSVKPEIATHYLYKTGILYRFLLEYQDKPIDSYLQLQYNYVMAPLSLQRIASLLEKSEIQLDKRDKYMEISWEGKSLTVYEDGRHVEITCESMEHMEEFFFPALRKSPGFYFVISSRMNDYGWLSFKNKQILNRKVPNYIF